MAQKRHTTNLTELLLQCVTQPDPMLSMLEQLCTQLMEAEVSQQLGAEKIEHSESCSGYRCGYRPRRLDTRMGTMYLMMPKVRQGGYIPFFVTERKHSEAALIQVVQEAFVQSVSTRKMEKLARSLGIESLSRSQVSEMAEGLNEQVTAFHSRSLSQSSYPILQVDALYEKVRMDGRIISMAILVVCGVDEHSQRDILAIEPMLEESEEVYLQFFRGLRERGLCTPRLVVSDAHAGLVAAACNGFPGASWQRCKVHFMRNILVRIPHKDKDAFAQNLKTIWLAPTREQASKLAEEIQRQYKHRFPKAICYPEDCLGDPLSFYAFPPLDARKISSTNMLERLNREIRRRTSVVGIFPSADACTRLVTIYLMEYAEDWSASRAYLSEQSVQAMLQPAA